MFSLQRRITENDQLFCLVICIRSETQRSRQRIRETRDKSKISESFARQMDRLRGLVVRVSGYSSRGPGSIPGATRFFLRSRGSGTGSTQPREDN
jgi:hypothetical protein